MKRKASRIFFAAIITLVIAFVILGINIQIDEVIKVTDNKGEEYSFFRIKLFDYNIHGVKRTNNLFSLRIISMGKEKIQIPKVITIDNQKHFLFVNENSFDIFSLTGEVVATKSIERVLEERIVTSCISDLNNDNTDEILFISGDIGQQYGKDFRVFSLNDGVKEVYFQSFETMNPWKVQTSDVDGDGNKEISIAMYKETKFHPVMGNRPYIYDWVDNNLFPKWRGSRLSKPFDDYIFEDIDDDGADELISIEILQNGGKVINSYKWKGFGFEGLVESKEYEDIFTVVKDKEADGQIYIHISEIEEHKWVALEYGSDGFIEKDTRESYVGK